MDGTAHVLGNAAQGVAGWARAVAGMSPFGAAERRRPAHGPSCAPGSAAAGGDGKEERQPLADVAAPLQQAAQLPNSQTAAAKFAVNVQKTQVVDEFLRDVQAVKATHPTQAPAQVKGLAFEAHQKATFNLNAIDAGASHRAQLTPAGHAADLIIVDPQAPQAPLAEVQLKASSNPKYLKAALSDPKYAGMQKVVSEGMDIGNSARGFSDRTTYGGVSSDPLSAQRAEELVLDPSKAAREMQPNVAADVAGAALYGGALGAVLGGAVPLVAAAWAKGGEVWKLEGQDLRPAAEGAAVGGTAGATMGAVSAFSGSGFAGGVAGGVVVTAYSVFKSPDADTKKAEAAKGVASTLAAVATGSIISAVVAPVAGTIVATGGAVAGAWYAGSKARSAVASLWPFRGAKFQQQQPPPPQQQQQQQEAAILEGEEQVACKL